MDLDYLNDYEEAATPTARPRPTPGAYLLRLPTTITYEKVNWGGREGLVFHIGGAEIAEGEFAGAQIGRFVRVSTLPRSTSQKFSDAGDLLKNFGVDITTLRDEQAWIDAFNDIAGQVTPNPVYLTYQGRYKNSEGNNVYLKARDFADGNGGFVRCLYLNDGVLSAEEPGDFNALDDQTKKERRVWANLEPGFRGFAPRKASA